MADISVDFSNETIISGDVFQSPTSHHDLKLQPTTTTDTTDTTTITTPTAATTTSTTTNTTNTTTIIARSSSSSSSGLSSPIPSSDDEYFDTHMDPSAFLTAIDNYGRNSPATPTIPDSTNIITHEGINCETSPDTTHTEQIIDDNNEVELPSQDTSEICSINQADTAASDIINDSSVSNANSHSSIRDCNFISSQMKNDVDDDDDITLTEAGQLSNEELTHLPSNNMNTCTDAALNIDTIKSTSINGNNNNLIAMTNQIDYACSGNYNTSDQLFNVTSSTQIQDISPQDNSTLVITDLPRSSEDFTLPFSYSDSIQNLQNLSTSQELSLTQPPPSTNDYLQNQTFPLGNSVESSNSNRTIQNTLGNHTSDIYQQKSSHLKQQHQPQESQPLLQSNTNFQKKFVQNSQFSEAHALHQDTNNNNNNNSNLNNNNIVPNLMSTLNYYSHGYQGNNTNNNLIQPSLAGSTQLMDPTNYLLSSLKQPQISPSDLVMLPNFVANNLLVQSQALNPLYSLLLNTQQPRQLHPYLAYPPTLYPIPQQMHTADQLASNLFTGFGNPSSHFSYQQQQFTAQQQFPLHNSRLAQPRRTQYYNNERNLNEENMEDWKRDMINKESRILKERYGDNNLNTSRHLNQPSDEFNLSNQNFPPQKGRDDNQQLPMHIPHHSTEEINNENILLESNSPFPPPPPPHIIATTNNNNNDDNNNNNDNDNNCVDTLNQKREDEQNILEEQQNNNNNNSSSSSSNSSSSSEDERAADEKNKISYPNLPATSDEEGANSSHDNNTVFYDQNTQFQANNSPIVPGFITRRSQNQQQSTLVVEKHTSLESISNPHSLSNSEHATDLLVVSHSQTSTFPQDTHIDSCPDQSNILVLSKSQTSNEICTTPSHFISPTNAQDSIFHEESDLSSNITFPPSLNTSNTNSRNNTKSIAKLFYPPTILPNVCYPPNDSSILVNSNKMDLSTHLINTTTSIFKSPPIELATASNEQSYSTMLSSRHYKKVSFNLPSQPTNKSDMFTIDKPSKQTKRQISYPPSYSKHTSPPKKTIQHPTQLQADNDIQILYPPTEFKPLIKYPPKFLTPPNSTLANPQLTSHMNHSIPPFKSTYHVPPPIFNFIPSMETQHSPPTRDELLYKDIIYPPKHDLDECISSCASNDVSNFFEDSFAEYSPKHDSSHYELLRPPPLNDVVSIDKQTQVSHSNILSETFEDSSEDNQLTSTPIGDQKESKIKLKESFDEEKIQLDFDSEIEETNKKSDHPDSDSYQSGSNTDNFHSATESERPIDKDID